MTAIELGWTVLLAVAVLILYAVGQLLSPLIQHIADGWCPDLPPESDPEAGRIEECGKDGEE